MKISIIGAGYVGLVSGVGFSTLGIDVVCIEKDESKVKRINSGDTVIFEKDLQTHLKKSLENKKFIASSDYQDIADSQIILICVGTPSNKDGSINLSYIQSATNEVAKIIKNSTNFYSVIVKSTVVPGTTMSLSKIIEEASGKRLNVDFGMGMVPEFLKEGVAVDDFFNPDRVVIGYTDSITKQRLQELHQSLSGERLYTNPTTAEAIKYASNGFLSVKISFVNELANYCEKMNINVDTVTSGMGLDRRIGPHFLKAGLGFGGSCFTKDASAFSTISDSVGVEQKILNSALFVNTQQPSRMIELSEKANQHIRKTKSLNGLKVTVAGLAFKPGTDDIRDSPSIKVVNDILAQKVQITATDPKAISTFSSYIGQNPNIKYIEDFSQAITGADLLLICTNWPEFKIGLDKISTLMNKSNPIIVDAWRTYSKEEAKRLSINYLSIGGDYYLCNESEKL